MYARGSSIQTSLSSIAHYFIRDVDKSSKLHLGGPGYELTFAVNSVLGYFANLTDPSFGPDCALTMEFNEENRDFISSKLQPSFEAIKAHESLLVSKLLSFLTDSKQWDRGYRVVGNEQNIDRAPTISFVVTGGSNGQPALRSQDIVNTVCKAGRVSILGLG